MRISDWSSDVCSSDLDDRMGIERGDAVSAGETLQTAGPFRFQQRVDIETVGGADRRSRVGDGDDLVAGRPQQTRHVAAGIAKALNGDARARSHPEFSLQMPP